MNWLWIFLQLLIILFTDKFALPIEQVIRKYGGTRCIKALLDLSCSECILVRSYYSKVVIVIKFK